MPTVDRVMYYSKFRDVGLSDALETWSAGASAASYWGDHGMHDVAVYTLDTHVCLYAETAGGAARAWDWPAEIAELFERWPSPDSADLRCAVPMLDVFHDGVPIDAESWRGDREVADRVGSLTFLKPEMFASYVFHHFQRQEELPESFNRTYMIGSLGTLLFSYSESPATAANVDAPARAGQRTPTDWHAVMQPHFDLTHGRPDAPADEPIWRRMHRLV
ncbi:hypothetical protein [Agromyces sp. Root81]|uniref:hypothetical protein n=1 Tax=Agromyces sp. Root81 TaxID=1736601 RepID=UPI0009EB8B5F|nr:hypothetical protein [Agromyces sp. Root81]